MSFRLLALGAFLIACGDDDGDVASDGGDVPVDAGPDCRDRPADAPEPRGEVEGVFDAERGRLVFFGGDRAPPEMCIPRYDYVDEVWAFQLDCNSWELVSENNGPAPRGRVAVAHDTMRERMLVFGGRSETPTGAFENYNDVWAFDLASDTWSQVTTAGTPPSARSSAVAGYDAARDRLLVFGGNTSTNGLAFVPAGDTFSLDLVSGVWTEIGSVGPSPRLHHAGVMHEQAGFVVFGGTPGFGGGYFNDTWALDPTTDTWRQLAFGGPTAPLVRFGAEVFADAGRLIMVMGHDLTDLGNRNDVWSLDVASGTWSELRPGDTLNGRANGPCSFPADFTLPEPGAPERREIFAQAQSDTRGFVFGGKTDCGNINDVWSLEFASAEWELLRTPTAGEACNRSAAVNCSQLCF